MNLRCNVSAQRLLHAWRARKALRALCFVLLIVVATEWRWIPAVYSQGRGVVEGKLVNGTDPKIVPAGIELDVIQLGGGMSIIKSAVTDSAGRFKFDGLPTDSPLMIRANYQSANYHGRVNFDAGGKATVDIEVFETTKSMKSIRVTDVRLGFQSDGEHLRVLETYTFVNETSPKRTFMNMEGNFRFAKPEGIAELPRISVTAPGSSMPLTQSPLESPDGQHYYSLYPLRPGKTTFEVEYDLPYHDKKYTYRKRFYHDIDSYQIGVVPQDMSFSGEGLQKVHTDTERNFAVFSGEPIKVGGDVIWTFSGGTPVPRASGSEEGEGAQIKPMPNPVGQNALILGPLMLMALIAMLWYAFNKLPENPAKGSSPRTKELKDRRERLLDFVATLDARSERNEVDRAQYVRQRAEAKRQLRRISMLQGKK